jgi:hypothetical protein
MTKNIFGSPNKNDFLWTYKGKSGDDVVAPFDGQYLTVDRDGYFQCLYTTKNCTFKVLIGPLKDTETVCSEGQKIGVATNETIYLKISKGNENFKIDDFFQQNGECFTEKKEENNNPNNNRKRATADNTSILSNPYKFAARISPVGMVSGGIKALIPTKKESVEKEKILEEIERIKQLLK